MRNQPFPHHKILPVKSLVQSARQKKQYLFLANKQTRAASQNYYTPRNTHSLHNDSQAQSRPVSPLLRQPEDKNQNKSLNNGNGIGNEIRFANTQQESNDRCYTPLEQFYCSARPERYSKYEQVQQKKGINHTTELKVQNRADITPKKERFGQREERSNVRIALIDRRESFKSVTLRRDSGDLERDSSFASGKMDEQTWNASRMEKIQLPEKEPQPLFKNQVNKLKTELFQKEANLFELSQKLQEKQTTIREMSMRLSLANQTSQNLSKEGNNQASILAAEVERLTEQVAMLSRELNSRKEEFQKCEDDSTTNRKLLMLKIRQYEIDEHEKTQYIIELKEREKKNALNCEKLINGQKQLLRQKESQLVKVSEAAQFYKQAVSKNIEEIEDLNRQLGLKQEIVKELSSEISDLKSSLNELQKRMREMIDNQDDLRKQIQIRKQIQCNETTQESRQIIKKLKSELQERTMQILSLRKENSILNNQLYELKEQVRQENSVKQFELSMMHKTCEDYKKKLIQYQKYSGQFGVQLPLKSIEQKLKCVDEYELNRVRGRDIESPNKAMSSPRKSLSSLRDHSAENELKKMKQLNVRLFRDNDKMISRIRDFNLKINKINQVNKGLNELIVQNELSQLSKRLKEKINDCQ